MEVTNEQIDACGDLMEAALAVYMEAGRHCCMVVGIDDVTVKDLRTAIKNMQKEWGVLWM